jgi:hypothetical protein
MTRRISVKATLLAALIALSIGGLMLHVRIHSPLINPANIIPVIAGILSIIVVPWLFAYKSTIHYGYVLNGMLAIVGTVIMAHFSIAHWPVPATFGSVMLKTLLSDILILWTAFFIGKAVFDLEMFGYDPIRPRKGIRWRYPNMGWWIIHLAALSIIYTLGHLLWRQS